MRINWQSTKFLHAMTVQGIASYALFSGHMDGPTWVAASTIALGIYSAADVFATKVKSEAGIEVMKYGQDGN